MGISDLTRSQHQNKQLAFKAMVETKQFKAWHILEVARRTGKLAEIEDAITAAMADENIKVEVKGPDGRWITL